jgi:N-acetylmuramoyl-L-alanine amidase
MASSAIKTLGAIVLDPGHGGTRKLGGSSPNNAISISGVLEKNLALDFCKILKAELESRAAAAGEKVDVFLTRTTDVNVGIADRAKLAGAKGAKLFLTLHFNGLGNPTVRGVETYYADKVNGNTNEADDKKFAGAMHAALVAGMRSVDSTVKDRGLKSELDSGPKRLGTLSDVSLGNVGKAKKCLAAYFEVEFITNPTVEKVLISGPGAAANRAKVMGSVAEAMLVQIRTMP